MPTSRSLAKTSTLSTPPVTATMATCAPGNDGVLHPVDQLVVVITDQREHALGDVGIVLHKLRDPGVDGAVIALEIGKEQRYARDQLGDQDAEEQIHESQRKEPGHKDAQAAHQSSTLDAEPVAEETVEKVHDGREQVGHRQDRRARA